MEYKNYKCQECGKVCRAWIESLCYEDKVCPTCINKLLDKVKETLNQAS